VESQTQYPVPSRPEETVKKCIVILFSLVTAAFSFAASTKAVAASQSLNITFPVLMAEPDAAAMERYLDR
jgi:hypothetical protein